MHKSDVQAFIDNVELRIDWDLPVSEEERKRYENEIEKMKENNDGDRENKT